MESIKYSHFLFIFCSSFFFFVTFVNLIIEKLNYVFLNLKIRISPISWTRLVNNNKSPSGYHSVTLELDMVCCFEEEPRLHICSCEVNTMFCCFVCGYKKRLTLCLWFKMESAHCLWLRGRPGHYVCVCEVEAVHYIGGHVAGGQELITNHTWISLSKTHLEI